MGIAEVVFPGNIGVIEEIVLINQTAPDGDRSRVISEIVSGPEENDVLVIVLAADIELGAFVAPFGPEKVRGKQDALVAGILRRSIRCAEPVFSGKVERFTYELRLGPQIPDRCTDGYLRSEGIENTDIQCQRRSIFQIEFLIGNLSGSAYGDLLGNRSGNKEGSRHIVLIERSQGFIGRRVPPSLDIGDGADVDAETVTKTMITGKKRELLDGDVFEVRYMRK